MQLRMQLYFGLQMHRAEPGPTFHLPLLPSPSQQGCPRSVYPPTLTQVQHLVLGSVEPHEFPTGLPPELFQVSLDAIPSPVRAKCTTQLGAIYKLPTVCVIDENISTGPSTDPEGRCLSLGAN